MALEILTAVAGASRRGFWTLAVLVLAACSDPSQPTDRPASIQLLTEPNVTVAPQGEFPVTALVADATGRGVVDATVVFSTVRLTGEFAVLQADTARTDASGVATIEAAVGPAGDYQVIATIADAQIEPAIVNVNVTPDAIVRLEIFPNDFGVAVGASVKVTVRALDRFDNEVFIEPQFRNLTPDITEISSVEIASAWVTGLELGTGLIVVEHGGLADTARVSVLRPLHSGLALGAHHSCLLPPYENGNVYCWGAAPAAGAATDTCGTSPCVRTPRLIASALRFEAIAAGGDQTCALSEGALYCWGRGPVVPGGESTTPQRVPGGFSFTSSFTVGRDHACATTVDGEAYCWGDNARGQLGTGDLVAASTPTPVLSAERFTSLHAGPQFTCGGTAERTVHCWGANSYGQLGRGTVSESEPVPAVVPDFNGGATISAGAGEHVCAVGIYGTTFCWGRNDSGQFDDGTTTSSATPRITSLYWAGLVTTAAGTCSSDGKLIQCVGAIGGYQYNSEIVAATGHRAKAGDQHVCAITIQGSEASKWRCWGDNSFGALGDGTLNSSRVPVEVASYTINSQD